MIYIEYQQNPANSTQTTISAQEQGPTVTITNCDMDNSVASYIVAYIVPEYCCDIIPDDEPVGITLVLITLKGYLRTPIEYLRQSMHPV